ncbi:hypothetical protein [Acinetobacter pseudolwoffii]|uniref:hypothetical protein n=1 Tax=Acinetobacter pseudolwoffii TaxID=2053287 RepID=UPI00209B716F|nr:hypothetical protein [Acinetobacter pseudolwoffii]MCO8091766.1 hypothetical protein [Acinetobacter pseudolwoffii]
MTQIFKVSTDNLRSCPYCRNIDVGGICFEKGINHMLTEHNYQIEHIGTETIEGDLGLFHTTVAILSVED